MLKNILCIIAFFYIQGILGGLLGPNLRFDAEGNVLNKDVPMDFMKLVASKVKGEKDGKTKEVVEVQSQILTFGTKFVLQTQISKIPNPYHFFRFFRPEYFFGTMGFESSGFKFMVEMRISN